MVIQIQCSWCKKILGMKKSEKWEDKAHFVTHSICDSCYQTVSKDISRLALSKNSIDKPYNV